MTEISNSCSDMYIARARKYEVNGMNVYIKGCKNFNAINSGFCDQLLMSTKISLTTRKALFPSALGHVDDANDLMRTDTAKTIVKENYQFYTTDLVNHYLMSPQKDSFVAFMQEHDTKCVVYDTDTNSAAIIDPAGNLFVSEDILQ